MSREIKFRAWDKENECWLNFGYASIYRKEDGEPDTIFKFDFSDNYIVEQYTGLKDKNGKEIYEGDIVSCGDRCPTNSINYNDGRFWLGDSVTDLFEANLRYDIEVIGNVHQNPELLEGKK